MVPAGACERHLPALSLLDFNSKSVLQRVIHQRLCVSELLLRFCLVGEARILAAVATMVRCFLLSAEKAPSEATLKSLLQYPVGWD
jgi:hypothetical protein